MSELKQTIVAMMLALVVSAIFCRILIPILHKLKFGQQIRALGPQEHLKKQGTPTMGGIAFIAATVSIAVAVMHLQLHTGLDAKIAKAAALESELSSMRMRNDEMENKINVGIDYAAIYDQAVNDLGMTYPGKDQLIYYTAEKSEYFEMNADNTNP